MLGFGEQDPRRFAQTTRVAVDELQLDLEVAGEFRQPDQHHVGGRRRFEQRVAGRTENGVLSRGRQARDGCPHPRVAMNDPQD